MTTMLITIPKSNGRMSKSEGRANHPKSDFAFFFGIFALITAIPMIKYNRLVAGILLALSLTAVLVAFLFSLGVASTEISHLIPSTVNFTLPYVR
jgi:ABC-type multidrug transport system permease subunit